MTADKPWLERNAGKKLRTLVNRDLLVNLVQLLLADPGRLNRATRRLLEGPERITPRLRLGDILDEETVAETCARLAQRPDLQDQIIQSILQSQVYREFMAEMLYRSIRDFLLEENFITQRLPIAGRLVRMGQAWASNTLERIGGDTGELDVAVTQFLEKRLGLMDRYAESLLKQAMSEKRLRRNGELLWNAIKDREITLDPERIQTDSTAWQRLSSGLAAALVDALLAGWGEKRLRELV